MDKYFVELKDRLKGHPYADDIENFILGFDDKELKKYLSFLYLYMPYADIANVDKDIILDYAKAGVNLRSTRCKDIDEDIFLNYVLFHRIGSEKIVANRTYFYNLVNGMLGDSELENIIKLNYFCGENVVYRTTDIRTQDPISIFNAGFGRCGEESIFAVSVFRAAGIPARQIYVPLWAHCDDNHAWVEVFVNGDWHYLGACEPEEILDKGWFDDASARSMIVKNILYGNIKSEAKDFLGCNAGMYEINQTKRYADTKHIKIYLYDGEKILSNTDFNICLMNFALISPIIKAKTDIDGLYETDIGIGNIFLSLYIEKNYIIPLDLKENDIFYIDINEYSPHYNEYREVFIDVPPASTANRKKAPTKRAYKYKTKEFPNVITEEQVFAEKMQKLWDILSEKDKRDISIEVLRDCFSIKNIYEVNEDIYLNYISNPRVYFEHLYPNREFLKDKFSDTKSIINFIKEITLTREKTITSVKGLYGTKIANALSAKIFTVNVLRSLSIPAKLENADVYIYKNGNFKLLSELNEVLDSLRYIDGSYKSVDSEDFAQANLCIKGDLSGFGEDFSLSKYDNFENNLISLDKNSIKSEMTLPAGEYVLATQNRLPNGNIFAKYNILRLESGNDYEIQLEYAKATFDEMLSSYILPVEIVEKLGIKDNEDIRLITWIKEDEEPSQHIANDLILKESLLKELKLDIIFTGDFMKKDSAVNELLSKSCKYDIHTDFGAELQETFGRSVFVNHETLPIVALCKGERVVYAFSGYSVGSGNLIEKILETIKEKNE